MPNQRKIDQVAELTEKIGRAQVMLIGDYRGLTVAEITDLRKRLREAQAELIVSKNTLALIAAKANGHEGLDDLLLGPTALALAYDDVSKAAKAISDFNRGQKQLSVRGGLLGKSVLRSNALEQVGNLPSRQQVLAQIVGGVSSPVSGVVGVLNAAITNVLYVLQARIDQLEPPAEAGAGA